MLDWIVWNRTVFDIETVLVLNWIVWNKTDYLYKNRFGIKYPIKVDMPLKPTNQPTNQPTKQCQVHLLQSVNAAEFD